MSSPPRERPIKPAKAGKKGKKDKDDRPSKTSGSRKRNATARISAACEACKKRKTRCTGGPPPCQLCESLGTECVIDLSLDMRRRAALQRTMDESKMYQDALNGLIDNMREGPSPRLDSLLEYIRSGATNQEITSVINHHLNDAEDSEFDQMGHTEGTTSDEANDDIKHGYVRIGGPFSRQEAESRTSDGLSSHESEAAESGKWRTTKGPSTISTLLVALRNCTVSEGEDLLRRFVASEMGEKAFSSVHSSRSNTEGVSPSITNSNVAERHQWHPALQDNSMGNHPQESRKVVPSATISTDIPMYPPLLASPPAAYLEPVTAPSSPTQTVNHSELCVAQEGQQTRLRIPVHLVLPLVIEDDSYMSRTYVHYVQAARHMLERGVPWSEVLGPGDQVTVDLFFRNRLPGDKFDCSSWASEVCRSFDNDVFVRLATVFMLTFMMRWLLVPTLENYEKLPDMMKPTPAQCMIPHIGAIETIPLAPVRDAAIYQLRDWLTSLNEANWTVNWPHGIDSAVEQDPVTGATVLTSRFIDHVTNSNNWSVGISFLNAFPEVAGRIRIH
ncbi:uncharacterized protein Z518_06232 [Rhinocladiella mackenziei CBS 650.93]|uniref:Rhinocladiella mackenziei CBS 650.93 unplaced genomic scaffold supercont1.4, whole genome shotgun sequence n=1 Tax=Rhinocladiella mackenziei CBS 650.93 TaxID=1442369 RepID=A0A0D2J8D6_9EURO|nr:uncharacterized protein Z518_06232 [Rhinocladiella mackenziei CBS 650.93]KIX05360.1 hypothetical protein Z518_06232 [Rhinocladiella mackenziei CBS 650.93]